MKRLTICLVAAAATTLGARPADVAAIQHVMNRIAYGVGPGDVERVRAMGLEKYIDRQLHPERIPDSNLVAARLSGLTTVTMSGREIAERFEQPLIEARRARRLDADAGTPSPQPNPMQDVQRRANVPVEELAEHKVLRAIYSERQLEEVLTDFWFNHFNVDARKGRTRFFVTEYERDDIRPHVLGRFRDLLEATAKSPAMLFYLDNWISVSPDAIRPANRPNMPTGLNENYGRELLELHTLGVDGGYTQQDVTEVARAFTGWTIGNPRQGGGFVFRPRLHDDGSKVVLGRTIAAGGGESDGEQVLDLLAHHPSTARFIATKLATRFVSDTPPQSLVDRAADRFRKTDGDLREVMRTILLSPEFLSPSAYNTKTKTPFEFAISAVRSSGAAVDDARPIVRLVQELGMPLYRCQPPTGYKDTSDAWLNSGGLVARMNAAVRISRGDEAMARTLGSPQFQRR